MEVIQLAVDRPQAVGQDAVVEPDIVPLDGGRAVEAYGPLVPAGLGDQSAVRAEDEELPFVFHPDLVGYHRRIAVIALSAVPDPAAPHRAGGAVEEVPLSLDLLPALDHLAVFVVLHVVAVAPPGGIAAGGDPGAAVLEELPLAVDPEQAAGAHIRFMAVFLAEVIPGRADLFPARLAHALGVAVVPDRFRRPVLLVLDRLPARSGQRAGGGEEIVDAVDVVDHVGLHGVIIQIEVVFLPADGLPLSLQAAAAVGVVPRHFRDRFAEVIGPAAALLAPAGLHRAAAVEEIREAADPARFV